MATPGPRRGFFAVPFCKQNGTACNASSIPLIIPLMRATPLTNYIDGITLPCSLFSLCRQSESRQSDSKVMAK